MSNFDCPDCGVQPDQPHLPSCEMEECHCCGGPLEAHEDADCPTGRFGDDWPGPENEILDHVRFLLSDELEVVLWGRGHNKNTFMQSLGRLDLPANYLVVPCLAALDDYRFRRGWFITVPQIDEILDQLIDFRCNFLDSLGIEDPDEEE